MRLINYKSSIVGLIALVAVSQVLIGCSKSEVSSVTVTSVPVVNIENFDKDTKEIVKLFGNKSKLDKLEPVTPEENSKIKLFLDSYRNNPKLSKEQQSRVLDVSILDNSYSVYLFLKDSKDSKDIETSNKSVKNFYDQLKSLEREGFEIK